MKTIKTEIKKAMSERKNNGTEVDPFRFFGIMLSSMPSLMFRLGGIFLRFKRDAKKAGKVFRKELIDQGLDKATAAELTGIYLEGSDLLKYMQYFRSL